jgi:hypothetical protein
MTWPVLAAAVLVACERGRGKRPSRPRLSFCCCWSGAVLMNIRYYSKVIANIDITLFKSVTRFIVT